MLRLLPVVLLFGVSLLLIGQTPAKKQFLYKLTLTEKYHTLDGWEEADNATVAAHFSYLQDLLAKDQLILAGRTDEDLDKTFGLVIFAAADEVEARQIMENDPAVKAGIMNATLHPYQVALIKE